MASRLCHSRVAASTQDDDGEVRPVTRSNAHCGVNEQTSSAAKSNNGQSEIARYDDDLNNYSATGFPDDDTEMEREIPGARPAKLEARLKRVFDHMLLQNQKASKKNHALPMTNDQGLY